MLFVALALCSVATYAQTGKVGINTETPTATLEVKSKTNDGSQVEGALLPAQSKQALATLEANGKTPAEGTLVFVNDVTQGSGTTVAQVYNKGYYIFENGTWNQLKYKRSPQAMMKKQFVCTANNLGEILQSSEGYFECVSIKGYFGELVEFSWKYYGVAYLEGLHSNYNSDISESNRNYQKYINSKYRISSDLINEIAIRPEYDPYFANLFSSPGESLSTLKNFTEATMLGGVTYGHSFCYDQIIHGGRSFVTDIDISAGGLMKSCDENNGNYEVMLLYNITAPVRIFE